MGRDVLSMLKRKLTGVSSCGGLVAPAKFLVEQYCVNEGKRGTEGWSGALHHCILDCLVMVHKKPKRFELFRLVPKQSCRTLLMRKSILLWCSDFHFVT